MNLNNAMRRNVQLYLVYTAVFHVFAWTPVFILYFSNHMSLERVLQLEAIYYAAVVILEVPSGYFSDSVGRKPTLLISSLAMTLAYTLFLAGSSFGVFAIAQVFMAIGISFNSGTDTSLHYDSLSAVGEEHLYGQREALNTRNGLLSSGVGAMAGGLAGMASLSFPYAISLGSSLLTVFIVLRFTEPPDTRGHGGKTNFLKQMSGCAVLLKKPVLAWMFGFSTLMVILNHIPYEFYQPWLDLLNEKMAVSSSTTPLSAGLIMAVAMVIGAWTAQKSIKLRDKFGLGPLLLMACLLQICVIFAMSHSLHLLVVALLIMRSVPRALFAAPMRAAIAPEVGRYQRATWFSLQSLSGRLSFSATLFGLSKLADSGENVNWETLSRMLLAAGFIGLIGLIILFATSRALRSPK